MPLLLHHRSLTHVMTHSCHNDYSRIGSIGRLINYIQKTETSFALQWRAAPFGVTSYEAGRLQRKRALKSFLLGVLITSSMRLFVSLFALPFNLFNTSLIL